MTSLATLVIKHLAVAPSIDTLPPGVTRWWRRRRAIVMTAALVVTLGAEVAWWAPYAGHAADALATASPDWVCVAVAAEICSMMSFARLQRVLLRSSGVRVMFVGRGGR